MNKFSIKSDSKSLVVGIVNQRQMKIDASSSVFTLLSEGLYTNPSYSAFSEILSNAWDAHIDADRTDIPVRIKFDEQMITITDRGLGIPHDKFEDLYETLGGTSKANDLTKTGGMGIGKFAPFSVADSFIVKNSFGGICKTYALTKGSIESDGFHTTTELSSVPCEDTGFEVSYHDSNLDDIKIKTRIDNMKLLNINVLIDCGNNLYHKFEPVKLDSPISFYSALNNGYEKPGNSSQISQNEIYMVFGTCVFSVEVGMESSLHFLLLDNMTVPVIHMSNEDVPFFTPNRETLIDCEHNTNLKNKAYSVLEKWWNNNKHIILNKIPDHYYDFLEDTKYGDTAHGVLDYCRHVDSRLHARNNNNSDLFHDLTHITTHDFLLYSNPPYNINDAVFATLSRKHGKRLNGGIPREISLTGHKLYRKILRFITDERWGLYSFSKSSDQFKKVTHITQRRTLKVFDNSSVFLLMQRILLCETLNIYQWSDTNITHGGIYDMNVSLKFNVDRQEFIDYFKKFNPDIKVNIIKPNPKQKPVTTKRTTAVIPRQRFQTLGDYLNCGDTFDKLRGKYYIDSSDAKFVRDLMKTPSLRKRYISDVELSYPVMDIKSLDKLLSTKEFLEEAVIVEYEDLEQYSKRVDVCYVDFFNHITKHAFLTGFPGLANLIKIFASFNFPPQFELNGKSNNFYRLFNEHNSIAYPRLTPAHYKDLTLFKDIVLGYGNVFAGQGHLIYHVLDSKLYKHFDTLVELNNTKLFSPLVTHLKGKTNA